MKATGSDSLRCFRGPELRQAGFSSYLTKPCEPDRVRAQVEKHIAGSG